MNLDGPRSFNNRIILEAYQTDRSLRGEVKNGFALVDQKVSLKGLRVLIPAKLTDGTLIPVGSIAYIKEEFLHNTSGINKRLKSDTLKEQFIIVDIANIEYIVPPEGNAA